MTTHYKDEDPEIGSPYQDTAVKKKRTQQERNNTHQPSGIQFDSSADQLLMKPLSTMHSKKVSINIPDEMSYLKQTTNRSRKSRIQMQEIMATGSSKYSRHKSVVPYHHQDLMSKDYEEESSGTSRAGTRQAARLGHGIAEKGLTKKWKQQERRLDPIDIRGDTGLLGHNRNNNPLSGSPFSIISPGYQNHQSFQRSGVRTNSDGQIYESESSEAFQQMNMPAASIDIEQRRQLELQRQKILMQQQQLQQQLDNVNSTLTTGRNRLNQSPQFQQQQEIRLPGISRKPTLQNSGQLGQQLFLGTQDNRQHSHRAQPSSHQRTGSSHREDQNLVFQHPTQTLRESQLTPNVITVQANIADRNNVGGQPLMMQTYQRQTFRGDPFLGQPYFQQDIYNDNSPTQRKYKMLQTQQDFNSPNYGGDDLQTLNCMLEQSSIDPSLGHPRPQGNMDIRKMREKYTVGGAMADFQLPNNTFQKLFSPQGDFMPQAQKGMFEFCDASGKSRKIQLKKGQKLLLQDPNKPHMTILTDNMIRAMNKTAQAIHLEDDMIPNQKRAQTIQRTEILENPQKQMENHYNSGIQIEVQKQIWDQNSGQFINQQVRVNQKLIPELKYAQKVPKNRFFQTPLLTPITFVSKNPHMAADYIIESETEEFTLKHQQARDWIKAQKLAPQGQGSQPMYGNYQHMFPPVNLKPVYKQKGQDPQQMAAWMQDRNFRGQSIDDNTDDVHQPQPTAKEIESPSKKVNPIVNEVENQIDEEATDDAAQTATESAGPTQSEYSLISRTLDNEMRQLLKDYEKLKKENDKRCDLMLRRMRLKHPIFHLLTISAFKYLMDNGILFKPKKGQAIYKEDQPARANIYFVLFGQVEFRSTKINPAGRFGETISLGWTIGEEILYQPNGEQIIRKENCISINDSCMVQVSVDDLVTMSSRRSVLAGGGTLAMDYQILLSFLEKNFEVKSNWRREADLIPKDSQSDQDED